MSRLNIVNTTHKTRGYKVKSFIRLKIIWNVSKYIKKVSYKNHHFSYKTRHLSYKTKIS